MSEMVMIQETTQVEIAGHEIGAGNIWERDLPDAQGRVVSQMSARLAIHDLASGAQRVEAVAVGSELALGGQTWCVALVEPATSGRGRVGLRRMSP